MHKPLLHSLSSIGNCFASDGGLVDRVRWVAIPYFRKNLEPVTPPPPPCVHREPLPPSPPPCLTCLPGGRRGTLASGVILPLPLLRGAVVGVPGEGTAPSPSGLSKLTSRGWRSGFVGAISLGPIPLGKKS